ncbi:MAG: sodium:alanine symporter family protein, partial [Bacteroidales bacterium]|nr:sodium:alanine symporter family protein [Bacteroidales bacterium]
MQSIIDILAWLDGYISVHPVFIYTLLGTGVFLTVYLGFPQVRFFGKACRTLRGHYDHEHHEGDASHFQALSTALSGTVGTGNIAGVAMAIHLGGPAALFWMIVTALIGMATKYGEVTLSHKYREKLPDGTMAGGPMFYMDKRLNINIKGRTIKTGHLIAIIFSACTVMCAFGTGSLPQINNIATAMRDTFSIPQMVSGAVLAVALAAVVLGGIKRIVTVTEKIVPFMAMVYFVGATVVIIYHIDNLWPGIKSVVGDVFTGTAATGGFLGGTVALAMSR